MPHVGPGQSPPLIPSLPHILLYFLVSYSFLFPPFLLTLSIPFCFPILQD